MYIQLTRYSIIAIHDLGEDAIETWTHPQTRANWLRDFVPQSITAARVLSFAYEATAESFFGPDGPAFLQRTAETFVQELHANRRLVGRLRQPIIFICHGLGGIIVKKALVYSSTRVAPKVEHLLDAYVSTFAILFFGTPHDRVKLSCWTQETHPTQLDRMDQTYSLQSVSTEFAPHTNSFHLFFFWEELQTSFGHRTDFVVDHSSAVVQLDNIEKASVHANHADMVKFDRTDCTSFRTVVEALSRYCEASVPMIQHRWKQAASRLQRLRVDQAYELSGIAYDVHSLVEEVPMQPLKRKSLGSNHFYPPVAAIDNFVGRKELLQSIYRKLFSTDEPIHSARKSYILYGMGGSGKTQLCSKFAYHYRDRYHAVFTIHAASSKTIEDSLKKIALVGGLHPTESAGRHYLDQLEHPWLLIIDNADDPALDLDSLFPRGNICHVLVTTRNPKFRQWGTLGSLELRGLAEDEALELLLTRAEISEPWDAPTRRDGSVVAKSLGYLALALIHAANCICQQICTLKSYLSLHSNTRSMIQRLGLHSSGGADEHCGDDDMVSTVYSTFDISMQYLQRKQTTKNRDAVEMLKISAFYHFENIPELIFTRAMTNRRRPPGKAPSGFLLSWMQYLGVVIPIVQLPEFLTEDPERLSASRVTWALDELQSLSLISRNARQGTYSMHPLVHQWAKDRLTSEEKTKWLALSLNTLLESVRLQVGEQETKDESDARVDGLFYEKILPHLTTCLDEHGSPVSEVTSKASWLRMLFWTFTYPRRPHTIRSELLNAGKCAVVFADRGQFEKAALYLEHVSQALLRLRGLYDEGTLFVLLRLSNLYWGLGRLERSINLHNRVVQARAYINGPDHEQTLTAMSSLGQTYWLYGDYVQSLSILASTSEKMSKVLGEDDPQTLTALDNYGVSLGSWRRFEESMQIHKKVLDIREDILGPDHLDTLSTRINLGMAMLDLGRLQEAESLVQGVYHKRQQILGKEHPWTLWALCYLTKIYTEMGYLQKAEDMLVWGIEAGIRSLGPDHLGVLMGRGYLAVVYSRQGRLQEAEKLSTEILARYEKSRGIAHPDTIFCLWKMAILFRRQKKNAEAIDICKLALKRVDLRITKEHPIVKDITKLLHELSSGADGGLASTYEDEADD